MAGNRLFDPNESLAIRDPLTNERHNGNIINPPRFSQNGGLDGPHKTAYVNKNTGLYKNELGISSPAGTQRMVPDSSNVKQHR